MYNGLLGSTYIIASVMSWGTREKLIRVPNDRGVEIISNFFPKGPLGFL